MLPFYRIIAIFSLTLTGNIASAQSNFWEPLNGPNGVQNVRGIASDTSGQLFIAMNGKIYRSADNGDSWSECINGLPSPLDFNEFKPSPSGGFYLTLNNYSIGIHRYNPGTDSWTEIPIQAGAWSSYDGFDIDPQGRLWISTDEPDTKIFYSDDEGQSYQQVQLDSPIQGGLRFLAAFNDDHNLIMTAYKVYHFTKYGTVQEVGNSDAYVTYLGYNTETGTSYFADHDNFKRSPDGGLTWQNVILEPGLSNQPNVQKVFFRPGGKTWAHANSVVYYSEDDGTTWAKFAPFLDIYGYFFQANATWFHVNCGLHRTNDAGITWTDLSESFKAPVVYDIKKDGAGNLYALTCRNDVYEKSNDEGQTWTDLVVQDSVAIRVTSMATRPDGLMMAVGENDKLYRSFNNGANWTEITNTTPSGADAQNSSFYTDYNGAFYWFWYNGLSGALKSTDNGNTWMPVNNFSFFRENVAIHPNGDIYQTNVGNVTHYIAGLDTSVYVKYNNGTVYYVDALHCTASGDVYIGTYWQGFQDIPLLRIPNGSSTLEAVSFFNDKLVVQITSNAEGDVFVFTEGGLYRSDNNGLYWSLVDQVPFDYYYNLSTAYVSPDQYLYNSTYGDVIHRSTQPTAESNFVLGKVWLDNDGDCEYDAGEQLQTSTAVTATGNGDYTSFSGYNGNFTLSAPSGAYALNVKPPNALFEACFTDVPVTLDGPNDSAAVNLPLKAVAQCPYLRVSMSTPILRRCFDVTYTVRYKNEGTAVAEDAYVEVTLDSFFIFQSSTLPVASQNGFTYTFNLGDLAPGQSGSFNIVVTVSCESSLSQLHCINAQIYPSDVCLPTLPPIAFYRECRENIGSFDPNDKRAFVDGNEEPGYVLPNTDIEYLIRFQNTGTDTAFRVVVEDRLPTLLDLASVTPLVASHPYTMEVKDQRILRFIFDNILLPDSNINEAASHGFIKFRVSQMPNVPLGSLVQNEADIFFDFNAPVRTNESNLVVGTVSMKPEPGNPYLVTAYPNPFGTSVTFEIKGPALSGNVTMRLFDALGRQVRREEFAGEKFAIQREELETGLYYFLIESDGNRIGAGKVEAK